MRKQITRRDFLKLSGLLPLSVAAPRFVTSLNAQQKQQNVLIIVFDAFSAKNISFYGYPRETMPNLSRLADRAIIYHNHYANGNFTSPGTASLLTGTFPWTHRAINRYGSTSDYFADRNLFTAFPHHYKIAYTHNPWADRFLQQFGHNLDDHIQREHHLLTSDYFISRMFEKDQDLAIVSWVRAMKRRYEGFSYSLFISRLYEYYRNQQVKELRSFFPRGLPGYNVDSYFLLEDVISWLGTEVDNFPKPFVGYFHFYPPHEPYNTHREFFNRFKDDGYKPVHKPMEIFSKRINNFRMENYRVAYDEFILYVDREFGKLYQYMEKSGLLENTWIIFTSDHGEMLERGIIDHMVPVLYEPVVRVPLLIFEPGRTTRTDVYQPTSAIDVMPTLLHLTEQKQVEWTEGGILPPYNVIEQTPDRTIYNLDARENKKDEPLTTATVAIVKGQYKLMYFFGYEELGNLDSKRIELYDLEKDPEELNNLFLSKPETTAELLNEIKQKLAEVNEPYQ